MAKNDVYSSSLIELNSTIIKDLVETHYNQNVGKYAHFYDLYKGEHKILERIMSDPLKPNNKLVNDFFGQVIDDTVGYFLGKPIVFTLEDENAQNELENIFEDNDADDLFMETGKEMMIKGKSSVMIYQNENSETCMVRIPPEEVVFVYDSSKTNDLMYALRVYELEIVDKDEKIRYVEVYSKNDITYYYEQGGEFVLDTERANPVPHIFGEVPIVPFMNNEEEMSDLAKIESLVNDYNKIFSDASNEHEAYRNAYLMLKNMIVNDTTIQKLKEQGIIEVGEDGDVKFVTKDLPTDAVEKHLDRLEKNIHKFSQVPDMSDENFAGNLSGVAIKFKLFGLENQCIIKERKMTKGLKKLLKLLAVPIGVKTGVTIVPRGTQIQFTRNIPNNLVEIVDVVTKLNGTVDKETLLGLLPFVDNPQQILEKLAEEKEQYAQDMKNFGGDFNNMMGGNTEDMMDETEE